MENLNMIPRERFSPVFVCKVTETLQSTVAVVSRAGQVPLYEWCLANNDKQSNIKEDTGKGKKIQGLAACEMDNYITGPFLLFPGK